MAQARFSKVMTFQECSDAPNWSRLGIFSCHNCDKWRERLQLGKVPWEDRCALSAKRYQCYRNKTGEKLHVRIVCRDPTSIYSVTNKGPVPAVSSVTMNRRRRRAGRSKIVEDGKKLTNSAYAQNQLLKSAKAKSVEASLMSRKVLQQEEDLARTAELVEQQQRVIEAKDQLISDSRKKLKQTQSLIEYCRVKAAPVCKKQEDFNKVKRMDMTIALETVLSKLCPGKHASTKAKLLFDEILGSKLYDGEVRKLIDDYVHSYIRDLFKPWRVLKAGDVSAVGALKTSTIRALNEVIDHENLGIFPSASSVDRARAKLDKYAYEKIGYERRETVYGEVFYLNFEKALRFLLKACQLHDLAQSNSVKVSLAIDGADLFKDRTHVSAGIKITDCHGVHPVTKKPLFVQDDNGEEKMVKMQSSEMCCILIIADARNKKEMYEEVFREFYQWGDRIRQFGLLASDSEPALHLFSVAHTTDLKASWHLSNRGGGCKNKNFFCTFCPCTKNNLISYKEHDERCNRCKRRNKRKSYHHAVCDSVSVPTLLQCLEEELGAYHQKYGKEFAVIKEKSKLHVDHMQLNKQEDIMHIEHVTPHDNVEKKESIHNLFLVSAGSGQYL
jgi:hypothetical protein